MKSISTGNLKGYIATLEIRINKLYVKHIHITSFQKKGDKYEPVSENVIDKVFPDKKERFMSWYSGTLTAGERMLPVGGYYAYF